jgi:hypothetical protein
MSLEILSSPELLIGKPAIEVVKSIFELEKERILRGNLINYHYFPGKRSQRDPHIDFSVEEANRLGEKIESNLKQDYDIGISSRVELTEGIGHIPMIDFDCPVCPENLAKIQERLVHLSLDGESLSWAILDSGNSYQIYCLNVLLLARKNNRKTILAFAEKCHSALDFNELQEHDEIIHGWWFLHSAGRGEMCMRLTNNRVKVKVPEVVAVVNNKSFQ